MTKKVHIPDDSLWHPLYLTMILFSPKKQSADTCIQMFWQSVLSKLWLHKFKIGTSDNQLFKNIFYDLNEDIVHQTGNFSEIQVMMMMI